MSIIVIKYDVKRVSMSLKSLKKWLIYVGIKYIGWITTLVYIVQNILIVALVLFFILFFGLSECFEYRFVEQFS